MSVIYQEEPRSSAPSTKGNINNIVVLEEHSRKSEVFQFESPSLLISDLYILEGRVVDVVLEHDWHFLLIDAQYSWRTDVSKCVIIYFNSVERIIGLHNWIKR